MTGNVCSYTNDKNSLGGGLLRRRLRLSSVRHRCARVEGCLVIGVYWSNKRFEMLVFLCWLTPFPSPPPPILHWKPAPGHGTPPPTHACLLVLGSQAVWQGRRIFFPNSPVYYSYNNNKMLPPQEHDISAFLPPTF